MGLLRIRDSGFGMGVSLIKDWKKGVLKMETFPISNQKQRRIKKLRDNMENLKVVGILEMKEAQFLGRTKDSR